MADLPPGVIPVSPDEFDRLYPIYEREAKPGQRFQEWLKATRRQPHRQSMLIVEATESIPPPLPHQTQTATEKCRPGSTAVSEESR